MSHQLNTTCSDFISLYCYFNVKICRFLFLVLLLIGAIFASPGVTPKTKACERDCPDYKPICAGPKSAASDKEKKSFGSVCVMEKYNCEKNEGLCAS